MEITKCEFCDTYIANFEVHHCVRYFNKYRQTSATLSQRSSTNLAEDIELITVVEMDHGACWPSTSEFNYLTQESISNIHQRRDCEETAAAEMSSQYEVPNYYQYNPTISDFLFPGKPSTEESKSKSLNLQQTSEESKAYRNRNVQYFDASNPEYLANIPMSLTDQCVLPGFQQTFGQRKALRNQMTQHNNAVSQMEYPGISRKNEVSSDFLFPYNNFGETDDILTNPSLQYSGTSLEIPFLNIQKPQYSTRNLIRSTTSTKETETFPFTILTCDEPFHNMSHTGEKPFKCTKCSKCFTTLSNLRVHLHTHTGEKPYACNKCSKRYANNKHLKRHMLQHAGEERSKCDSCGDEFSSEDSLKAHKCKKNK